MTGIGAMLFYSTKFFQRAGIDLESSQFATIGVGGIIFIMTLVTVPLMDKLGRRTLFLAGSVGEIICHIVLTVALKLLKDRQTGKHVLENNNVRYIIRPQCILNQNHSYIEII